MSELKWNLGENRIKDIGKIVSKVRQQHFKVKQENTVRELTKYKNILYTLFFEIDSYVDDWDKYSKEDTQDMSQEFDDIEDELEGRRPGQKLNDNTKRVFKDLEQLDRIINDARIDEGLDIPKGKKPNPEDAGVDGLGA